MRISKITITNILGVEDLEFSPGQITEITGKNGTNKTSVFAAIQAALEGGKVGQLIRNGAESAEMVLILDDGTEIKRRLRPDAPGTLSVVTEEYGKIGRAQSYLDSIYDGLGLNPIELITASPERRGKLVIEAMPMSVSFDELQKAAGDITLAAGIEKGHALAAIARANRVLYDERTIVNRSVKDKRATISQLEPALSEDISDPETITTEIDKLEASKNEIDHACNLDTAKWTTRLAEIETEKAGIRDKIRDRELVADDTVRNVDTAIRVLEERLKSADREKASRETVQRLKTDESKLAKESFELSNCMDRIDALKENLMENLPLPIDIHDDGEIYQNGVPFATLNTAAQFKIAMSLATLRAKDKKLKLICVDGLEMLDSESLEELRQWATDHAEFQFILTRVTDDPFRISSSETINSSAK